MSASGDTIRDVEEAISALLAQRTGIISELKRCNQKRRELGEELGRIANSIRDTRASLDQYYRKNNASKELRRDILAKIREMGQRNRTAREELAKFEKIAPRLSRLLDGEALQKTLEGFEWKLQTQRLTKEEEKQLVRHIKESEAKLRIWREAYAARTDLSKLMSETQELKASLDDLNATREGIRPQIGEKKKNLEVLIMAREQLQEEWDALTADIHELEENLHRLDADLTVLEERRAKTIREQREIHKQQREAQKRQREAQRNAEEEKQKEALRQMRKELQEKLARGEKVTFEQLKLVFSEEQSESLK